VTRLSLYLTDLSYAYAGQHDVWHRIDVEPEGDVLLVTHADDYAADSCTQVLEQGQLYTPLRHWVATREQDEARRGAFRERRVA
jgi:hypothetical protein